MNLNVAIKLMIDPNRANLMTNFIMKLNSSERNNFMRNSTNKKNWIKRWIREKHGLNNAEINEMVNKHAPQNNRNTFNRYVNTLYRVKNANMNLTKYMNPKSPPPYVNLRIGSKGFIQLEPVCKNNHSKGMYIHYGETKPGFRGQKIGLRLRTAAVKAALNSKILLYQVSQNIEGLVKKGNLPISGKIMKSLGAHQINYAPPCRSENLRGSYNYAFVVGNKPLKRPMKRPHTHPRTVTKRTS